MKKEYDFSGGKCGSALCRDAESEKVTLPYTYCIDGISIELAGSV
jgi:hypothetical protein